MSWMERLYKTYEQANVAAPRAKLWPISHFVKTAHIELVLDCRGELKTNQIKLLSGKEASTLIPATEESAGRAGSKIAPHPLCDEIGYCASDFPEIVPERNQVYLDQLKSWSDSEFSHPKVQAIYKYLQKKQLWRDLSRYIEFPITFTSSRGQKTKISADKVFIRWRVEELGNPCSGTWEDDELIDKWIQFDQFRNSTRGLCVISGIQSRLIGNHSRFIRNSGDGAKLISSNDSSGYTFRGRFFNETQACGIGFGVSQKAHNALRWLITQQGIRIGEKNQLVYVAWAVSGKKIPQPLADSFWLLTVDEDDLDEVAETEEMQTGTPIDHSLDTGQSYALQLRNYMSGYAAKLSQHEQITIMGIDSATPGRMGIVYYREMLGPEFLQRLETWHSQFAWPQRHTLNVSDEPGKKPRTRVLWPIGSPLPKNIASATYGENADDTLKKKVIERLLPCIVDGQPFPTDLLENCVRKAINRNAYPSDKHWLWEKNLGIACALFKGFYARHPHQNLRRDYAMALEEDYAARDYLYGRLLAIAEYIEEMALNVGGETRPTTAARLMQRFADRPFETWRTIELALQPYMQRLRVSRGGFLANRLKEIDAIQAMFDPQDFISKEKLSGEFLLGYHCQRHHFKHKSEPHEGTPDSGESA